MQLLRNAIKNRRFNASHFPSGRRATAVTLSVPIYPKISTQKVPVVTMIPRDSASSLPTSPAITQSPSQTSYGFKPPKLSEILANDAPEPWTLGAFTEYCQQNLCLENLNFIMEAKEYGRRYDDWVSRYRDARSANDMAESAHVIRLWRRLVAEYTTPGGPQEVNLPGDVRHALHSMPESDQPTHPDALKPAVRKIRELMQDSILLSFINDVRPPSVSDDRLDLRDGLYTEEPHQEEPKLKSRSIQIDSPPWGSLPTQGAGFAYATSNSKKHHGQSMTSNSSSRHHPSTSSQHSARRKSVVSMKETPDWTGSTSALTPSLDESNTRQDGGRTPPPLSPLPGPVDEGARRSTKSRSDSGWKKFGAKLGLKKTRGGTPSRDPKENEHAIIDD